MPYGLLARARASSALVGHGHQQVQGTRWQVFSKQISMPPPAAAGHSALVRHWTQYPGVTVAVAVQ